MMFLILEGATTSPMLFNVISAKSYLTVSIRVTSSSVPDSCCKRCQEEWCTRENPSSPNQVLLPSRHPFSVQQPSSTLPFSNLDSPLNFIQMRLLQNICHPRMFLSGIQFFQTVRIWIPA